MVDMNWMPHGIRIYFHVQLEPEQMSDAIPSPHPGAHGPWLDASPANRPLQTNAGEGSDVLRASYPLRCGCNALAAV